MVEQFLETFVKMIFKASIPRKNLLEEFNKDKSHDVILSWKYDIFPLRFHCFVLLLNEIVKPFNLKKKKKKLMSMYDIVKSYIL